MSPRPPVYICSALRGITALHQSVNQDRAGVYSHHAVSLGYSPYTPHIFLTRFLDDGIPEEREAGIECGKTFLLLCTELWAFTIDGVISTGMRGEIDLAIANGIPVRWFAVNKENVIELTELNHLRTDVVPRTADLMLPPRFADAVNTAFDRVAAALKDGHTISDDALDGLLGTGLEPRDAEAEEAWERHYRETTDA